MGSITGSGATAPTAKGITIPGTVRATIQDLARRSANRKAPPARAIERAGQFSPRRQLLKRKRRLPKRRRRKLS